MVENSLREEHEALEADITKMKDQFKGRGLAWGGVRGDSLVRIVRHYLWKHISSSVKLAKNAWVEGCGIEFDLMVVDRMARRQRFTNIYPRESVHLLIEVKGAGYFHKLSESEGILRRGKERVLSETGEAILYLLLWTSEKRYPITISGLGEEDTFILTVGKRKMWGEWERFVNRVKSSCGSSS